MIGLIVINTNLSGVKSNLDYYHGLCIYIYNLDYWWYYMAYIYIHVYIYMRLDIGTTNHTTNMMGF